MTTTTNKTPRTAKAKATADASALQAIRALIAQTNAIAMTLSPDVSMAHRAVLVAGLDLAATAARKGAESAHYAATGELLAE